MVVDYEDAADRRELDKAASAIDLGGPASTNGPLARDGLRPAVPAGRRTQVDTARRSSKILIERGSSDPG
jgi:hypothetical protein